MFRFPTRTKRAGSRRPKEPNRLQYREAEEQLPTIIQGKPVKSKEEARVAIALEILGWSYIYQRPYFGGRTTPGGIILDFLVLTPVTATPLWVNSRYWHSIRNNRQDVDVLQKGRLERLPGLNDPIEVWDHQLQSIQQAVRALQAQLGRP